MKSWELSNMELIADPHNEHYKEMPIEPFMLMRDLLTKEEFIGFIKGNMIKYALRAGHKGGQQGSDEDVDKYYFYAQYLRETLEEYKAEESNGFGL